MRSKPGGGTQTGVEGIAAPCLTKFDEKRYEKKSVQGHCSFKSKPQPLIPKETLVSQAGSLALP